MSAVKKIVEAIDNKDVSALAESFHEAIAPKIMERIQAESVKAFDKAVDKLDDESGDSDEEDEESEIAEGRKSTKNLDKQAEKLGNEIDKRFDSFFDDPEMKAKFKSIPANDRKKAIANLLMDMLGESVDLQEAVKLGKPESLNFGRELDLTKAEKENPSQMTGDLYDAIVKKLFKGAGSVTNKEAATSKNKIDIHTKNRHRIVTVVGGYVKEQDRGDGVMGTKPVTKYYKIG